MASEARSDHASESCACEDALAIVRNKHGARALTRRLQFSPRVRLHKSGRYLTPQVQSHRDTATSGWLTQAARSRSWLDRCNGGHCTGRVVAGLRGTPAGTRSACAARDGGPGLHGRRPSHPATSFADVLRRVPASQPPPRQSSPADTVPAASQTLLPPPHSSPSVPDLAPSHHRQLHQRCARPFLRHEMVPSSDGAHTC